MASSLPNCTAGLIPAYEVPGSVPMLCTTHVGTLGTLVAYTKMMHDKVQLGHPVFAIVFQEMIVLCSCEALDLGLLVLAAMTEKEQVFMAYLLVARIAALFHATTWLVVTYLRYYLLVKIDPWVGVDYNALRKKSLIYVWALFFPFLILSQGTAQLILISQGWPEISMDQFGPLTAVTMVLSGTFIANLPDLISMVVYLKMWRHFKNAVIPTNDTGEQPYGGIWVGEVREVVAEPQPDQNGAMELREVADSSPQPDETLDDDEDHETHSVLKALKWHLKLALADAVFAIFALMRCSLGFSLLRVGYLFQVVCFFWVPFLVVKNGFRQLNGMREYLAEKFWSCI